MKQLKRQLNNQPPSSRNFIVINKISGIQVRIKFQAIGLAFFALVLLLPTVTLAAPAFQINYQGKLTDTANTAVADGDYNLRFKLCTDSSCSSIIFDESHVGTDKVTVTSGLFSVMIGSVSTTLDTLNFNQNLYLEVNVGGTGTPSWETLLPRKILGSVPNSFNTQKFDGLATTSFLRSDITNATATVTNLNVTNATSSGNLAVSGAVGLGGALPTAGRVINLSLPATNYPYGMYLSVFNDSSDNYGIYISTTNTRLSGTTYGVYGHASAIGNTLALSPNAYGVYGKADSDNADSVNYGVYGTANGSGINYGLYGAASAGATNYGLYVNASDSYLNGNATTTGSFNVGSSLGLNSEYFTDLTGLGLTNYNNTLRVATTSLGLLTTDVAEGTNLYWTSLRATSSFISLMAGTSTSILAEGSNQYWTSARATSSFNTLYGAATAKNPFNQWLDTTNTPTFVGLSLTGNATTSGYLTVGTAPSGANFTAGNFNVQNAAVIGTTLSAGTSTIKNLIVQNVSTSTFAGGLTVGTSQFVVQQSTGNVGIGTESPQAPLHVLGINANGAYTSYTTASAIIGSTDDEQLRFYNDTTNNLSAIQSQIYGGDYGKLLLNPNGGNVGIGTTTPQSTLSVNGNLDVGLFTDNVPKITFNGLASGYNKNFYAGATNLGYWDYNNYFVFQGGNRVGIGKTFPSTALDVNGTASSTGLQVNGAGAMTGNLTMSGTAANIILGSNWLSGDGGDEGVFVSSIGNVGIGTVSPNNALEIKVSSSSAVNNALRISNTAGQAVGSGLVFFNDTPTTGGNVFNSGRIYSAFDGQTYPTARLTLQSPTGVGTWTDVLTVKDGNVGIGTTTPDSLLQVGNATSFFKVNSGNATTTGYMSVGSGAAATDSFIDFELAGVTKWTMGNDATNNNFVIATGTALGSSNVLTISPTTGNIEIGNDAAASSTSKFSVYMSATQWGGVNRTTGAWMNGSDMRLKTNLSDLESPLSKVLSLHPVRYDWVSDSQTGDVGRHIGFIAQEVETILPELVSDGSNSYKALSYAEFAPVLAGAIKEQQQEIDLLKSQLSSTTPVSSDNTGQITITVSDSDPRFNTIRVSQAADFYGTITVRGEAGFESKAVFKNEVEFQGHLTVDGDTAGMVTIPVGAASAQVVFGKPYETAPRVVANLQASGTPAFVQYLIADKSTSSFSIILSEPATQDLYFDWIALAAKGQVAGAEEIVITPEPTIELSPSPEPAPTPSSTELIITPSSTESIVIEPVPEPIVPEPIVPPVESTSTTS